MSACARFHRAAAARNTGRCLDCGRCWGRRWSASCGVRRYLGSAPGSTTRRFECGRVRGLACRWTARPGLRRSRPGARSRRRCARRRRRYGRAPCEIAPTVRRLYRRHCAGVASGEFAREQGLLQSTRAHQRSLPRLALCGPRDRRAVALRRRGRNWAEVARRCGCSVRTAQGASERLARLRQWENGRLSAGQFVQRASLIRVLDSQVCRTLNVCTPPAGRLYAGARRARPAAAVSSSPGTFGWAGYGRAGAVGTASCSRAAGGAVGPCAATSDRVRAAVPVPRTPSRSGRAGGCSQVGRGPSSSRLQRAHRLGLLVLRPGRCGEVAGSNAGEHAPVAAALRVTHLARSGS